MAIIPVAQLADNFAYLVYEDGTRTAAVVDCAEADKVLAEVQARNLDLKAVLSTHWHADHVGGNQDLVARLPGLRVYGARAENGRIPALTDPVDDGDRIHVGRLEARVIGIPAHTNGHVAYYFPELKALFSGDTLFIGGCGRVFEGKAATMVGSLGKLAALPADTQVYCGHEYTQKNLQFALTLEPQNSILRRKYEWAVKQREKGEWTIPSTIAEELATNPFLRTDSPELQATLRRQDPSLPTEPVAVFARVRELKDHY